MPRAVVSYAPQDRQTTVWSRLYVAKVALGAISPDDLGVPMNSRKWRAFVRTYDHLKDLLRRVA